MKQNKCKYRALKLNIVLAALAVAMALGQGQGAAAQSADPNADIVRSGCEINYPPFCIVHEDGRADGFSVELMRAALQKVGREVTFRTGLWTEVRDLLERGEVDALPLVGRTPEREELFDFTVPYLTMRGAIVVREETEDVRNLADLRGRRVGVMKGDNAEEFLRREERGFEIVTAPTFADSFRDLAKGRCDAVVIQRLVAIRLLEETGLKGMKIVERPVREFSQDFCFAVKKGDAGMLSVLNEGLALAVADGTHRRLHAKWFAQLELPQDRPIVVGGDHNLPPFEFLDENGRPAGYNVDLTRAIAREMGLDIEIRLGPWAEIVQDMEKGEIDLLQGMFYLPERDLKFDFTQPHTVHHYISVVRKGEDDPPATIDDLSGKRIVVQRGDAAHDFLVGQGLAGQVSLAETQEEALRELAEGKHDCALAMRIISLHLIQKRGWKNLVPGRQTFLPLDYCYAAPNGHKAILAQFSEGLEVLEKRGKHHRIYEKWLGSYEPSVSFRTAFKNIALVAGPLLLIALLALFWSLSLRRQVAAHTRELRNSLERFQAIFEAANVGKSITLPAGEINVNKAFAEMLGYTPEELVGKTWQELTPPEDIPNIEERIAPLLDGREDSTRFEKRYVLKDGGTVWADASVMLLRDTQGRPLHFITTIVDISERKRAEEALMRQLRFEQAVAEASKCLLGVQSSESAVPDALTPLLEASGVSRVYIFENFDDPSDGLCAKQTFEVCAPEEAHKIDNPLLEHAVYSQGFERWRGTLSTGNAIRGDVRHFPDNEREVLELQEIVSILVLPLFVDGKWWGFVGFDETRRPRDWHDWEVALLGTGAEMLGAYFTRRKAEEALCRHAERLQAVIDILQHDSGSIQQFLDYSLDKTIEVTASKIGYIYFYDEERRQFILNSWSKDVMKECAVINPQTCYELDKTGVWGEAVRQRKPIVLNDFQTHHPLKKGCPEGHVQLTRFLTIPVFHQGRIVAVVGVANKETDYDETDVLELTLLMDAVWKSAEALKSEQALRESEAYQRRILETTADGFWVADDKGCVAEVNEAYCAMSGYTREEILGMNISDLDAEEKPEETQEHIERIVRDGSDLFETTHRRKDGSVFPVELSTSYLKERGGQIVCFCRNLTRRKKDEARLSVLGRMLDDAPAAITIHDTDGRFIFANAATVSLHGYGSMEEFIEVNLHELDVPESEAMLAERIRHIAEEGEARFEVKHYRKDGSTFPLAIVAKRIEWQGQPVILSIATDITERKQAEQALRRSHELLQYIVEHTNSAVAVHDCDLCYIYVSQRYLQEYGIQEQNIIGKHHYDVFPDLPEKWRQVHRKALAGEVSSSERDAYERANGTVEWTRWECRPWYEEEGSIGGIIVYTEVITERVEAEETLAEQQALLTAIYRNAPLVLMIVDGDRRIRQINGFASQLADRPVEEMLGLRSGEALRCLHALDDPEGCGGGKYCGQCMIRKAVLDTLKTGETHLQVEAPYYSCGNADGETREITFLLSTTPLPVEGTRMVLVTLQDITERKQAEAEREKLQSQLNQAQKMESVGRLAGGVAHDFNNMLGVILGHTELAFDTLEADSPLREDFEQIRKAAERSADLTRQLLAFARKQTIAPKVLDLNETIASMLKMLERLIGEDIDLLWKPSQELAPVRTDPGQVDQMLANLAVNARDAIGHHNGKITIETANAHFDEDYCATHAGFTQGDYVMLAVSDDGCGMDEETRLHIFEPFFTTKDMGQGTGLGLATIYGIVKQNNGFVNVYSEPGKGSIFRIYLPAIEGQSQQQDNARTTTDEPVGGNETILVVEDEATILNMARIMLERLGYTVLTAATPGEAMRAASERSNKIDLLITDVVMPEMNGRDLARSLQEYIPHIRCLFMSGYTANVIAHQGVLDEGVNFIPKPFSPRDLARKVREVLEK